MKNIQILAIAALTLSLAACEQIEKLTQSAPYAAEVLKVEANSSPYSMDYYQDPEARHYAMLLKVENGEIQPAIISLELRPGRMPHQPEPQDGLKVSFADAEGRPLGTYLAANPMLLRACEDGDTKPGISRLQSGTIEVLLPFNKQIATVSLDEGRKEYKPVTVPIGPRIKRLSSQQRSPDERGVPVDSL